LDALTRRDFRYPGTGALEVTVRKAATGDIQTLELPYWSEGSRYRRDAAARRAALGIEDVTRDASGDVLERTGYDFAAPPAGLIEAETYVEANDPTWTVLRTGFLVRDGRAYALVQALAYNLEAVRPEGGGEPVEYLAQLRAFVADVKARGTPLILDLRYNGGGQGYIPGGILAMLARPGETYADRTSSFRVTRMTRQMIETLQQPGDADPAHARMGLALREAVAARSKMTHEYAQTDGIEADPAIGGLTVPVVALIGPRCGSACDIQAMLFKASGRVRLIGQPPAGTGAGFRTTSTYATTEIGDDADVFKFDVPNFLFGEPVGTGPQVYREDPLGFAHNAENRPVDVDVPYASTTRDWLQSDAGWMERAMDELDLCLMDDH
jgi:hypothetical protein